MIKVKKFIQKPFEILGYQIKKLDNGFSIHHNLNWLIKYNIKNIFDIGANEGQFAEFINRIFPEAIIHSFEPIPNCFIKLKKLKNRITKLNIYNYALGDVNDFMEFNLNEFSPSSSLMNMKNEHVINFPNTQNITKIDIEIRKLGDVVFDLELSGNILMKIDVQGFEEKVISGGKLFIEQKVNILIIESSIKELYENEASFDSIYLILKSMGFRYHGNLNQLYSPIDGEILQVDAIFIKD